MPVNFQSMDFPRDSRRNTPAIHHRTRLLGPWLLAACTALLNIRAHDVVIQHIRVRMGTARMSKRTGTEPDAMGTINMLAPYNILYGAS